MVGDIQMEWERDARWLTRHVSFIKEGGLWAIPRSSSVYRIEHGRKTAVLTLGKGDGPTEKVFEFMGWTIEKGEKEDGKHKMGVEPE